MISSRLKECIPNLSWCRGSFRFKDELFAGFVGAILVIPQGITFSYLAGVSPELGIYGSIFVALFASLFGNSILVSGPNTAVSILIGIAILPYAGRGSPLFVEYVLLLSLMVGGIQLLIWFFRGGHLFQYFSSAVISAIIAGVGVLIMVSSLKGLFGLGAMKTLFFYETLWILWDAGSELINPYAAFIGIGTVLSGWICQHFWKRYYILVAMFTGYVLGLCIHVIWPAEVTQVEFLGWLPFELFPFQVPHLTWESLVVAQGLFPNAVSIALIGLAQSLVIIKELKISTHQSINMNREVYAQGMSNLLAPFFSSFAGSGSFNRTRINQEMGSTTPLSAILSAGFVMAIIFCLGSSLAFISMHAMSGVLFIVGLGMVKFQEFKQYWVVKQEFFLYVSTFLMVVFIGLQPGIFYGLVASIISYLAGSSKLQFDLNETETEMSVGIKGNMFYATTDQLIPLFHKAENKNLILNLEKVSYFDHAASSLIEKECKRKQAQGQYLKIQGR